MPNRTKPGAISFTSVSAAFASGNVVTHETMNIGPPTGFPGTPSPSNMYGNPNNTLAGNNGNNGGNMDIVMGAPTNALAALTASLANPQTLYQMCSDTRRKLRKVQGYERFLELPPTAERLDVVTHVWLSFKLGSSLCHLFNMLLPVLDPHPPTPIPIEFPDFDYPEGNGVFTWALLPQNVKSCKKGAAKFIVKLTELQKEGKWPLEDTLWAVHELLGDDTSGLMKVLRTVNLLLERLPESAWIRDDESPSTPFGQSDPASLGENNHLDAMDDAFANMGVSSSETTPMPPHSRSTSNSAVPGAQRGHHPSISNGNGHSYDPTPKGVRSAATPLTINTALDNHGSAMPRTASGAYHNTFAAGPPTGIDIGPVDVGGAAMHVWEILKTEKKYVAELEIMQTYAQSLLQQSIVAPDTVHTIFANIAKLVNFSRRFLTALETEYEPVVEKGGSAWVEGRWGYPFVTYASDFEVYEPYCANYMSAISLVEKETPNLMRANLSLTVPELTSFLVLPIQRLCRYPLLLEKLSETVASTDYAYKAELADGLEVAKGIAEKVNETLRQHTNTGIVQELESRVKDWKGHHINDFGNLLLDGQFMVTKADMDRDYEVYLFEKMILCCKEVVPDKKDKKNSKSGSILKKDRSSQSVGSKKNMLNLKGRIYVNNLTHIQGVGSEGDYALAVYWRQQEDPNEFENFVLHLKNSEQFQKWHTEISKLMKADQDRREQRQREAESKDRQVRGSAASRMQYPSYFPMTPASELVGHSANSNGGFFDDDSRGMQEGTPSGNGYSSPPYNGNGPRRTHSQQGVSWASERHSENSMRSASGDHNSSLAQWRNHTSSPSAPPMPRKMSELSVVTEASFGNPHHVHRSKLSLGKFATTADDQHGSMLASTPENEMASDMHQVSSMRPNGVANAGTFRHVSSTAPSVPHPQMLSALRMRSASSPQVFQSPAVSDAFYPHQQALQSTASQASAASSGSWTPGVPYPSADPGVRAFHPSKISLAAPDFDPKRSSSSSFSSQPSDDSRPPDTPYSGQGRELRGGDSGESLPAFSRMVIVKVHSDRGVFKLAVPSGIDCDDLKNRVSRKVQMCAGGTIGSQVKCYYRDEEKEKLRLDDDDDLYTLFEPVLRGATREVDLEVKV